VKKLIIVIALVSVGSIAWLRGGGEACSKASGTDAAKASCCPLTAGASCASSKVTPSVNAKVSQPGLIKAGNMQRSGCCPESQASPAVNAKAGMPGLIKASHVQTASVQCAAKAAGACPRAMADCPMAEDGDECFGCCSKAGQCPFMKNEPIKSTLKDAKAIVPAAPQTAAK